MFDRSISMFNIESGKYNEIRFKKFNINYGLYNMIWNLILTGKGKELNKKCCKMKRICLSNLLTT